MSRENIKISAKNITKRFELMKTRSEKILNMLSFSSKKDREFWALKGVSFDVYAGEAIGIVGLNGSGKSTLLNIVSEIYPQTTGDLTINGDTSIISIGAGLKPALTGRDNIQLKLLMSGLTKKEIKKVAPTIIEFSELGDFIDQPVKSYSSGMRAKLGFSIMAHTNPDIMIIDEALSVGDSTFASKSFEKIREFKKQGKTIFFVSHSSGQVKQIADRVIWMHFGEMKEMGEMSEVMPHYEQWQKDFNKKPKKEREKYIVDMKRAQRDFSAVDIALQQLDVKIPNENRSRVNRQKRKELEEQQAKLVKKATKQTQKKIQNTKFGIINWAVVLLLIGVISFTSTRALANSQNRREEIADKKAHRLHEKKQQTKKATSKSKKSTSKSSTTSSIVEDSASSDQQTIVDANANGIPDDQETVADSSAYDSTVVPDTSYSEPATTYSQPATQESQSTTTVTGEVSANSTSSATTAGDTTGASSASVSDSTTTGNGGTP